MKPACVDDALVRSLVGGRSLYIWGCGHFGTAIFKAMRRVGIPVAGFMDKAASLHHFMGLPVHDPQSILSQGSDNAFIILAALLHADAMSAICREHGFAHAVDYLSHDDVKPYHFEIDVAGHCNLKCLTCPRGHAVGGPPPGMMSFDDFKRVIDKLLWESPLLSDVQLYSWGEPFLNKALPDMVAYCRSKGLATALSSNLSLSLSLEPTIKAGPTWFRVSLSGGDPETYGLIHRGGDFNLVVDNLYELSRLRAAYAPDMFVEVNYHLYQHNLSGVQAIAAICQELGFTLRTNYAFIDPVDMLIARETGKSVSQTVQETMSLLLLSVDEALAISRREGLYNCVSQNSFVIHSDLSFRRCTHLYQEPKNIMAENFLDTPFDEIVSRMEHCSVCRTCRELGIHRYHFAYLDKGTDPSMLF